MTAEGEISHLSAPAHLALGARLPEQTERAVEIHAEASRGGFGPVLSAVILHDLWEKFAFIAAYAGMTCLVRADVGAIAKADEGVALANDLLTECAAVADAYGHPLREPCLAASRRTMSTSGSKATSSMLRDVRRGGRTEHDHIIGDLLERARRAGVETPLLRVVRAHLQAYEATR